MTDLAFHAFREFRRVYSIFHITEDGIYKEDNVPEDYSGSGELKIEVVHEIFFVDKTGRLSHQYYDIPDAMDSEQNVGGGYSLDDVDLVTDLWYPDQAGPSTTRTKLYTRQSTRLPSTILQKALFMYDRYIAQKAEDEA